MLVIAWCGLRLLWVMVVLVVVYFGVDLGFCGFWWLGLSGLVLRGIFGVRVVWLLVGFLDLCWAGV